MHSETEQNLSRTGTTDAKISVLPLRLARTNMHMWPMPENSKQWRMRLKSSYTYQHPWLEIFFFTFQRVVLRRPIRKRSPISKVVLWLVSDVLLSIHQTCDGSLIFSFYFYTKFILVPVCFAITYIFFILFLYKLYLFCVFCTKECIFLFYFYKFTFFVHFCNKK